MKNNIKYRNLRAEMARENVTMVDIARKLWFNRDTLARKLSGKSPLYIGEAFAIRDEFFKGKTLEYLFEELCEHRGEFNHV